MSVKQVDVSAIRDWLSRDEAVLIDVREPHEFASAHINGAIHIPMSQFDVGALPPSDGKHLVFYCAMGMRSLSVASQLVANGVIDAAMNMTGGIQAWSVAGYPLKA